MTLWRFNACVEGWNRAQGGDERRMDDDVFDAMAKRFDQLKAAHATIGTERRD